MAALSHVKRQHKIALSDERNWNVFWPMEQSVPVQLASQMHVPESVLKVPWLEHCSGQVLFRISQLMPPQPGLQWHSPWWQAPWPEHIGSTQSTEDDSDVSLPLLDRISNLLIYPGHFDSATSQNHFLCERVEVLQCQMMAGEPQLNILQCLVVAGSNFLPYIQLAPLRYIIGYFQYADSIIMLHYRQ